MKLYQMNVEGLENAVMKFIEEAERRYNITINLLDDIEIREFDSKWTDTYIKCTIPGYVSSNGRQNLMLSLMWKSTSRKNIPDNFMWTIAEHCNAQNNPDYDIFEALFGYPHIVPVEEATELTNKVNKFYDSMKSKVQYLEDKYPVKLKWRKLYKNSRNWNFGDPSTLVGPNTILIMEALVLPQNGRNTWEEGVCGGLTTTKDSIDNIYLHSGLRGGDSVEIAFSKDNKFPYAKECSFDESEYVHIEEIEEKIQQILGRVAEAESESQAA